MTHFFQSFHRAFARLFLAAILLCPGPSLAGRQPEGPIAPPPIAAYQGDYVWKIGEVLIKSKAWWVAGGARGFWGTRQVFYSAPPVNVEWAKYQGDENFFVVSQVSDSPNPKDVLERLRSRGNLWILRSGPVLSGEVMVQRSGGLWRPKGTVFRFLKYPLEGPFSPDGLRL